MELLHQKISKLVETWRAEDHNCESFNVISEILDWCLDPGTETSRFLRHPQRHALETYWYLRIVKNTPHIFDFYKELYQRSSELREALNLKQEAIREYVEDYGIKSLWERIRSDDNFVSDFKLEALRESLTLDYSSYILALAMGAGKTVLIGAIIATEFAMALEYPDGPFVQNALVFAPGKTIIESLRELADIPYEKILPPRLYKQFTATVKLTFTRDGEKDIPVIRGSNFNLVVTNTEKIRIQKETIRKADLNGLFSKEMEDEAKSEVANLRLQAIASLPHLAVFSDEAHHTYGQSMNRELKKVRKTVDYLAEKTNLIVVVNTTGTPYFKRQPLKDVVFWYGLSQGIADGYLKDLAGNIQAYDFEGRADTYVAHVVKDFFNEYGNVALPNGSKAKLAIYFPQTKDIKELRPTIEQALIQMGIKTDICLVNTSDPNLTKQTDIESFNRLNNPDSIHRIMLLVNKGTEGWNCPSLFACALARKLRTSNNFVLQATTRCLRQVPGNTKKARVYLSTDNFNILDKQLQETYGESISDLNHTGQETRQARVILRKLDIPPLVVTKIVRTVVKKEAETGIIKLNLPKTPKTAHLERRTYTLAEQRARAGVLRQIGDAVTIEELSRSTDCYTAAVELSARYRLEFWTIYDELKRLYSNEEIPLEQIENFAVQIETQTSQYEIKEENVDLALALVKPEGFEKDTDAEGTEIYTADITYPKDREHLLTRLKDWEKLAGYYGFHYDPYNFDSNPEKSFFEEMLHNLNIKPTEVEDIYFTGAITDPVKTDFFVEYKDDKGKIRRYTPDFVIRKRPGRGRKRGTGRVYIIEIKKEQDRTHGIDGENGRKAMAIRKWTNLNPERLRYEIIFTETDTIPIDSMKNVREFIREEDS